MLPLTWNPEDVGMLLEAVKTRRKRKSWRMKVSDYAIGLEELEEGEQREKRIGRFQAPPDGFLNILEVRSST
jgi:hypothetical protein